ncbi:MAG: ABC-2 family transporter protein [Candidatus Latescibacteria bacterium]|nr:ABC-2 family transporter protein [Candidatus Latescibacterota bacterium]
MKGLADIYATLFRTEAAVQLQYRAALIIWLIGLVVQPVVYLVVWLTVAKAQGGAVGGFASGDLAAYYIALMVVNHLTFTWIMFEFEYRVRSGSFSPLLLQPLHPIHTDITVNIAYKALTSAVTLPAAAVLAWLFEPEFHLHSWSLAALIPALVLAFALRFLVEWCLALSAFWTTRVGALNQFYFAALLFLSGRMAPLELMPAWVQTLAALLPFRWMLAFPVELAMGRLNAAQALQGLAAQGAWVGASLGLVALVWRRGLKQYGAVGA